MTRRLVSTLFYSVDAVASDPHLFQHDSFDADLGRLMTESIARIEDTVMGQVTYSEWAAYWPGHDGQDDDFAAFINGVRKHVASRTLTPEQVTWSNASLIEGDLLEHVRALTLIIHPAIAGTGRRLFEETPATRLRLVEAGTTEKGNLVVTYGTYEA